MGDEHGVKRRFGPLLSLTSFRNKIILDIGCGFGAYGKCAVKYGASLVVGLDINRKFLNMASRSIEKIQADACKLPFKDLAFDIIVIVEVLEHLPCEAEIMQNVERIIKKDGLLFITAPNRFYPFETHGMKMGLINIKNILGVGIPFLSWMPNFIRKRVENARIYTEKQLLELLQIHGFEPVYIDYMMPPLDKMQDTKLANIMRKILNRLEVTWLKRFGCHIIIIAKRLSQEEGIYYRKT
jgi:2-polyprenyl-3-methyl-5-hydroxy-6-metoxy-1,4-benzoquinol methylase